MRDLVHLRRVGESALRRIADMFADDTNPADPADINVDATIIFADIEGFSDVVAREGDEVAAAVLDRLDHAVEAAASGSPTRIVKQLGDGVMLASQDPAAGLAVAAALSPSFSQQMADMPFTLRLRVGAHRGTVRQRGEDLIGYHVNLAARVAEQAGGGTCLVTAAAVADAPELPGMTTDPAGELIAKGVPERPTLYRLRLPLQPAT